MSATITSPQLEAITRLELAADALAKALRAVQHPDLYFAGGAIIAPSGLKHLDEIRATLRTVEQTIRPSDASAYEPTLTATHASESTPSYRDLLLTEEEDQIAQSVMLTLTTDLATALRRARAQLALEPSFATDPEFTSRVLDAVLADGSRLGRRIYTLFSETTSAV